MKYLLEAILTLKLKNGDLEKNYYALSYVVNKLQDVGTENIYYDKKLGIYYNDASSVSSIYELEVDEIYLNLDKSLIKSQDFFRRTLFRYDWMQIKVDKYGRVLSIDNLPYLAEQWQEIRKLLLDDYRGSSVEEYIASIDSQFVNQNIKLCTSQYFNFGLLFPLIPAKHKPDWQNHREVTLSDFDAFSFNECITYESTDSTDRRRYSISGKKIAENECTLNNFSGYMIVPNGDIHPVEAKVEVDYIMKETNINWCFSILQK